MYIYIYTHTRTHAHTYHEVDIPLRIRAIQRKKNRLIVWTDYVEQSIWISKTSIIRH